MSNPRKNTMQNYLYILSSKKEYDHLCAMEMRSIFGINTPKNHHFSNKLVDPSRSAFFKGRVDILYVDTDIESLEQRLLLDDLTFKKYKITFPKYDEVGYQERLTLLRRLGFAITGDYAMKDPIDELILTKIDGLWIFGQFRRNPNHHLARKHKPNNYSNALDTTLAQALINIAINNNFDSKLIDPCCGIGTVLIEGRKLGVDITGYEINPLVKNKCNENLSHFGLNPDVKKTDMLTTTKHFDVAILDLPYGQFSFITKEEQIALLKKTKDISDKSVIVTMDDMSELLKEVGFELLDTCEIKKSNAFSRYVTVCT